MSRLAVRIEKLLRAVAQQRSRRQRPGEVRRLLVAHNLLLGDTLLLAPLMKALALRYPDAQRFVLVRPSAAGLFEGRPYGFSALPFERRDAASQRRVLHSGPYDLAIVPDDNRYAWLARAAGASWIVAFAGDRPAWKNWMVDQGIEYASTPSAWADMTLALSSSSAGDAPDVAPYARGEWPAPLAAPFERPPSPYVVLHVGASTPLKWWPAARWRALADEMAARGLHVVWSAGRGEERILNDIGVQSGETDLAGRLDLAQLWHLLSQARLVVLPDTGVAHLARLIGVPTLALFGPGSAIVHGAGRFFAQLPYRALTVKDFACRDQHVLYRRELAWVKRCGRSYGTAPGQCPHGRCMDALLLEPVRQAALELLEARS
jgi:ADP-heptose:LPS heptosyltransferase